LKVLKGKLYHDFMRFFTAFLLFIFLGSCNRLPETPVKERSGEAGMTEIQYKKELEEIRKSLKGDVKIKLKKDGKGSYTWEISGKDAQEILKANEILKKKLTD
jgi:hypothetical protein